MRRRARSDPSGDGPGASDLDRIVVGRSWISGRLRPVEIGVDDAGTIRQIGRSLSGGERLDFGDAVLIPAATDLHVHTREPGSGEAETLPSATLQAAYGGVGLIAEMPNTQPPIDTVERLRDQVARVRGRASVDVLVLGLATTGAPIEAMSRLAAGWKIYLAPTTGSIEPPAPGTLPGLLGRIADARLPVAVHAEDPRRFRKLGAIGDPASWDASRPIDAENEAIDELLAAAPPHLRLHVAHVTTAGGAERIAAKQHSFEATPHHLFLSDAPTGGSLRKVNPPLRPESARAALLAAFDRGGVPILASDHAPHPIEAKELPFERAPSGVPGVETMLPMMLERARRGDLPLPTLVAAACDRPARWMGQPKGRIAIGHRADLLVIDFRRRATIRGRHLHTPDGWTPFEGRSAVFPTHHLRGGRLVVDDGEYVGVPDGRAVRPEYALN